MLKDQTQQYNSNCSRSKSNNFFFQCHAWHVEAVSEAHCTLCTSSNPSSYVPPNSATTTWPRPRPVARDARRGCARVGARRRSHLNPPVVLTGARDGIAQQKRQSGRPGATRGTEWSFDFCGGAFPRARRQRISWAFSCERRGLLTGKKERGDFSCDSELGFCPFGVLMFLSQNLIS